MRSIRIFPLLIVALALSLAACQKQEVALVGPSGSLGVVGFTQALATADLMAGFIPAEGAVLTPKQLAELDTGLAAALDASGKHAYELLGSHLSGVCVGKIDADENRPKAPLARLVAVGECMQVDYLLVPQVLYWGERQGSELGVTVPASVVLDLFMVDVKNRDLVARYHFDERQTSLTENLLEAPKLLKRKGKWITAMELAREGMDQGVKEFGL